MLVILILKILLLRYPFVQFVNFKIHVIIIVDPLLLVLLNALEYLFALINVFCYILLLLV